MRRYHTSDCLRSEHPGAIQARQRCGSTNDATQREIDSFGESNPGPCARLTRGALCLQILRGVQLNPPLTNTAPVANYGPLEWMNPALPWHRCARAFKQGLQRAA
jgi:hypothetical protein